MAEVTHGGHCERTLAGVRRERKRNDPRVVDPRHAGARDLHARPAPRLERREDAPAERLELPLHLRALELHRRDADRAHGCARRIDASAVHRYRGGTECFDPGGRGEVDVELLLRASLEHRTRLGGVDHGGVEEETESAAELKGDRPIA